MVTLMKIKQYIPYLMVLGMLAIATVFALRSSDMSVISEPAVITSLPDRVGEWSGEELSYCQNESCMMVVVSSELFGSNKCPSCGGPMLATWSLAEKQMLPADTVLVRKLYSCRGKPNLAVSIVISSSEEVSIHRPQMCLTGQGYDISSEETWSIPLLGRQPLQVRLLSLFNLRQITGNRKAVVQSFYAYWFVSKGYETPSSAWRIFYATWDRVFRGHVSRWAYVSIAGEKPRGSGAADPQLHSFIQNLYPQIIVKEKK